jgi:hypothetical protein
MAECELLKGKRQQTSHKKQKMKLRKNIMNKVYIWVSKLKEKMEYGEENVTNIRESLPRAAKERTKTKQQQQFEDQILKRVRKRIEQHFERHPLDFDNCIIYSQVVHSQSAEEIMGIPMLNDNMIVDM